MRKLVNNYTHGEILEMLKEKGYANVKFLVKMSKIENFGFLSFKSGSFKDMEYVESTIREFEDDEALYAFPNKYKLYVDSVEKEIYGSESYYVSDFISLLNEGIIKIVIDGGEHDGE